MNALSRERFTRFCGVEQALKKLISKSPGRTHWAMAQWRFFIVLLHHVAAQRQSIYFDPAIGI
jgi:hypothetical protein